MDIHCGNCNKKFKIPDEKIPNVAKFSVRCPGCGEKIQIVRDTEPNPTEHRVDKTYNLPSIEPEMHPPGSKVAFLFLDQKELFDKLKKILKDLDYIISTASNIEEALAKINLNRYDMIIFSDNEEALKILSEIDLWPGNLRRQINVIAMGRNSKTFDPNREFILGINSYISLDDAENIENLIQDVIKRHKDFLTPWRFVKENE